MKLSYPIFVKCDSQGKIEALIVPDLELEILDEVKRLRTTAVDRNEKGYDNNKLDQPVVVSNSNEQFSSFEKDWRHFAKLVIQAHINAHITRDKYFKYPSKIEDYEEKFECNKHAHWEKISILFDNKSPGFFERNLASAGRSINFLAAVANMLVQILSIEITAGEKTSGRNYGIPMSFIAFIMAVVTYNYSGSLAMLTEGGRMTDNNYVIKILRNIFPFKHAGECLNWLGEAFNSCKQFFSRARKKPEESSKESSKESNCYKGSTYKTLAKIVPALTLIGMQTTWTIAASIEAFQTSKTTGEKAKEIEEFMTEDLAYFLAIILAVTSGISMATFYVPFVKNCILAAWEKIDGGFGNTNKYLNHIANIKLSYSSLHKKIIVGEKEENNMLIPLDVDSDTVSYTPI
ncbi:MAG TPA: hypothetical protein VJN02_02625 [Gammaproteobacteria bacterium]|nr:hypothetical protein [Gammaproteobacteria bacterium]